MIIETIKNIGETMNDVINKYNMGNEKICYCGRLDPMARGKVILLTGDDCKKMDSMNGKNKQYTFEIIFGISTDTNDIMGIINNLELVNQFNDFDMIKKYINMHCVQFRQEYHNYSSIKYKGKSLWYYAKNNIVIPKPSHLVTLYDVSYGDIKQYNFMEWRDMVCSYIDMVDRKNDFRQDEIIMQYKNMEINSDVHQYYGDTRNNIISMPITITVSSGFYVRQLVCDIMKHINYPILTFDINRINII